MRLSVKGSWPAVLAHPSKILFLPGKAYEFNNVPYLL